MPLSISVATGSPVPIYQQIVDQVTAAVISSRLAEGERLPTVRALARKLLLNPNTVARAYQELAHEGVIESRRNRGSFVMPRRPLYTRTEKRRRVEPALSTYVAEALRLGFMPDEIVNQVEAKIQKVSHRTVRSKRSPRD